MTAFHNRLVTLAAALLLAASPAVFAGGNDKPSDQSLYDRLGGVMSISVVVSDFLDALIPDPQLNRNPAIDEARQRVPAPYLKYRVTAFVCQATGGPCQYTGRAMRESHTHLNITEAEWDRMVTIFKDVLDEHQVPRREQRELLELIGTTKGDIVAGS